MKTHHLLIGVVLVGGGYWYWIHKKMPKSPTVVSALGGNMKGYSSLSKTPPEYYNATSFNGMTTPETFDGGIEQGVNMSTPWTLPAEQGNAMQVNAGWTNFPDTYSAKVSHLWQQQLVDASHN